MTVTDVTQAQMPIQAYHSINDQPSIKSSVQTREYVPSDAAQAAAGFDASFQAQLSKMKTTNLLFQQESLKSIRELAQKNLAISTQLTTINQILASLTSELDHLKAAQSRIKSTSSQLTSHKNDQQASWQKLLEKYGLSSDYELGGAALLIFCFGFLAGRARVNKKNIDPAHAPVKNDPDKKEEDIKEEDDTRDEYDFMSSNEAIPAMLDLARSYIAMEDNEQARAVLKAIISRGNEEQQAEAKTLREKISS